MKMDTTWVEVFNTNVVPCKNNLKQDLDRFTFKGMHRGHAVFEYVLVNRDYGEDLLDELRSYVDMYRENVCQLANLKTAKISLKRNKGDHYYSTNGYHLWYYFLHFEVPAERRHTALNPEIGDLNRYWMLKAGKFFAKYTQSRVSLKDYDKRLGCMVVETLASDNLIMQRGGLKGVVDKTYGNLIQVLKDYLKVNFVEYHISEKGSKTKQVYAGYAGEELFFVEERPLD